MNTDNIISHYEQTMFFVCNRLHSTHHRVVLVCLRRTADETTVFRQYENVVLNVIQLYVFNMLHVKTSPDYPQSLPVPVTYSTHTSNNLLNLVLARWCSMVRLSMLLWCSRQRRHSSSSADSKAVMIWHR